MLLSLHFAPRLICWRFKVGQKSLFNMFLMRGKTPFIKIILIFCSVLAFIYQSTADSEQIQALVPVFLHLICIKLQRQCLIIGRRHNWAEGSLPCMTDFQQATLAFSLKSSSCLTYKHEQTRCSAPFRVTKTFILQRYAVCSRLTTYKCLLNTREQKLHVLGLFCLAVLPPWLTGTFCI